MLPVVLGGVLLPVMTNVFSSGDSEASLSLLRRTFLGNLGISFLPLVAVAPFGCFILRIYGPSYEVSWPVFSVMVAAASLFAAVAPVGHMLTATGRMWLGAAMNLGWSASYLALGYLLVAVHGQGAFGLAVARLLAYAVHAIWSLGYLRATLRRFDRQHAERPATTGLKPSGKNRAPA
jgi:O-antigen/teichoic acid export membrane protein